ncbi:putative 1,4-beta-D-xylan synthase transcription factor C2H2 family [Medicago truncatula]|uniref:Cellulose synthase-like protein n=1 Tax=Medicago truncatula TaxID=3880 RepID=A0A072VH75_MEDTR|nr:cellulose synthase-like protein D4 [Medicago truncatula]KEH40956.1 cellulose synthase-like protein [Medicago truncatula]RHN78430.1 putative 1,4-beta-D-xylan synthase transcription factor C2H2 family [Medicago truncatula]
MDSLTNQPSKKSRNASGEKPSIKFARRTSSGRYVSLSKEDIEMSSDVSGDYMNYTVHIPPTPDNQPMDGTSVAMKAEEQYVSNSLFTGGFNSVTRAHLMDKVIDSEVTHPQMAGAKGSSCSICDGKVMRDERGKDVTPCECRYKICRDCFIDAQKETGTCPGCKEPFKVGEYENDGQDYSNGALQLQGPNGSKRNQNGEFDHNKWLFETKGTYGVGNAYWPPDDSDDEAGLNEGVFDGSEKPWKPLCRRTPIPNGIITPYRALIAIRLVVMCFFLHWRVTNPNEDAIWLWLMSITCEIWFGFSWILDQIPKISPVNRSTDLAVLYEKFDAPSPENPTGRSDLPGCDLFVSTADPEKEPPLVTANTILSILAVDYPVEKLACYVSDDGGALLSFEAMAEAASFADLWVPFCRKHNIEPRNPDSYFALKIDPTKNKSKLDFVKDRRRVKREYDEFKVRINGLPDSIRRRSDAFNAREEMKMMKHLKETGADPLEPVKVLKATWMADGTHWPGTWGSSSSEHAKGDHAGILQVMLKPPSPDPLMGSEDDKIIDFSEVDTRLPMLVYVSREKRPGYDHNKKAGAMNALVRASAILSNGPFILNLDCDHYIYNCKAVREGMCFMLDKGGEDICYIQFPQRFEGIDPSDRYANHNTVFFDGNMRALDGLQGPFYVGTGCMFRRFALYGFDPPSGDWDTKDPKHECTDEVCETTPALNASEFDQDLDSNLLPKRFGNSSMLADSIPVAEFQGRPLADHPNVRYGRPGGVLRKPREPLDAPTVAESVSVISCWYEDKTEWGERVGWIYGSVTEDVVTGYRMHNRGWRSVYCVTKRDAFRGSAPINLTDRLHQVLRWATGSVEIFFSKNNAFLASKRLKLLQRLAYLNVGVYPFTSILLIVYCFLPALSLFSGYFIVQTLSIAFLIYLLTMTVCLVGLAILEVKWSGIELEQWWRNEQFWLISGTSAHLAAVIQGLLKVIAGIEISFTLTSKSGGEDDDDIFADLYIVKWSSLMIPPIVIAMVNVIAIVVAFSRTIYSANPQWSKFIGGAFFSFWVLAHLYPFAKGLMGRRGKTPTIVFVWSGLIAIILSLLWVSISPPKATDGEASGGDFQFP